MSNQATRHSPLGCVDGLARDFNISDLRYIQHHNIILSHILVTYFITGLKWDNSKIKILLVLPRLLSFINTQPHHHRHIGLLEHVSSIGDQCLNNRGMAMASSDVQSSVALLVLHFHTSTWRRREEGKEKESWQKQTPQATDVTCVITVKMNSYHG